MWQQLMFPEAHFIDLNTRLSFSHIKLKDFRRGILRLIH